MIDADLFVAIMLLIAVMLLVIHYTPILFAELRYTWDRIQVAVRQRLTTWRWW